VHTESLRFGSHATIVWAHLTLCRARRDSIDIFAAQRPFVERTGLEPATPACKPDGVERCADRQIEHGNTERKSEVMCSLSRDPDRHAACAHLGNVRARRAEASPVQVRSITTSNLHPSAHSDAQLRGPLDDPGDVGVGVSYVVSRRTLEPRGTASPRLVDRAGRLKRSGRGRPAGSPGGQSGVG
jgi:hypothetical protein